MPKHMTKGDYFSFLEQQYAPGNPFKITALGQLRLGTPIEQIGSVANMSRTATEVGSYVASRQRHLVVDWFGQGGQLTAPPPFRPGWFSTPAIASPGSGNPSPGGPGGATGWWLGWQGEPEKTLRCTLIRALEVSMALPHRCPHHTPLAVFPTDTEIAAAGQRDWPIQFFWVCGPTRFEGYVSWKTFSTASGAAADGVVNVILVTPGFDVPLVPYASDAPGALDNWYMPGAGMGGEREGTIFVGQDELSSTPVLTRMVPNNVVTHRMELDRGGSGTWP